MKHGLKIALVSLIILLFVLIVGLFFLLKDVKKLAINEVEKIVLKDVNKKKSEVTFLKTELDFENGKYVYEVELLVNTIEYEYEIDAKQGTILKKEVKKENQNINPPTISLEKAKEIALEKAGVDKNSSDLLFTKEKQEEIYEIEFIYRDTKYEYEIGLSGQILKEEKEIKSQTNTNVSLEQAKTIVFNHADIPLSASNISFLKEKQDMEDGRLVYEIEFLYQGKKYDYEVDANTGEILEYEVKQI